MCCCCLSTLRWKLHFVYFVKQFFLPKNSFFTNFVMQKKIWKLKYRIEIIFTFENTGITVNLKPVLACLYISCEIVSFKGSVLIVLYMGINRPQVVKVWKSSWRYRTIFSLVYCMYRTVWVLHSNGTVDSFPYTLLERFWQISLYVTDDTIAKLYVTYS